MTLFGLVLAWFLMLPLGMATDGCYEGDTEWVCRLSVDGQNLLTFTPVLWVVGGFSSVLAAAAIAVRFRRTPLLGIILGVLVYFAMIPLGNIVVERV